MILIKKNTFIASLLICNIVFCNTNKDSIRFDCLTIESSYDINSADTTIVYECIHILEHDSLIKDLCNIVKLKSLSFKFEGNVRQYFPIFKGNMNMLKDVEISGKKLKNMPSFICFDSLQKLMIEAYNYKIDFDLLKCKRITNLTLITNNTYDHLNAICQLENIVVLGIQDKTKKYIQELGCLKKLTNLTGLYLSLKEDKFNELTIFLHLKTLTIGNKISYSFIHNNLTLFENYEHVRFWCFTGTKKATILKLESKGVIW